MIYISQIEEMCDDLQDQFDDLKEECETKCNDVIERLEKDEQDIQTNTDNIRANAEAIDKLKVKHHFCKFHVKQAINKRFKDYFDKNPLSEDEKDSCFENYEFLTEFNYDKNIEFFREHTEKK